MASSISITLEFARDAESQHPPIILNPIESKFEF